MLGLIKYRAYKPKPIEIKNDQNKTTVSSNSKFSNGDLVELVDHGVRLFVISSYIKESLETVYDLGVFGKSVIYSSRECDLKLINKG